jgi:hypothetical protein
MTINNFSNKKLRKYDKIDIYKRQIEELMKYIKKTNPFEYSSMVYLKIS